MAAGDGPHRLLDRRLDVFGSLAIVDRQGELLSFHPNARDVLDRFLEFEGGVFQTGHELETPLLLEAVRA